MSTKSKTPHVLETMLTYKRPAGSVTEKAFIRRYISCLPGVQTDNMGNYVLTVGAERPTTLISCHTDTVHRAGGRQRLRRKNNMLRLETQARGDVLGADDGAGVYIALRMIAAKVPALYIFHRMEEKGGLGSEYIAQHRYALLDGIQRAVAFDRRGETDIITHQMMGRCCSDEFAWDLSFQLGLDHEPCPYGTFTDTANYTDLVPECTNVSVGYMLEHTHRESLDLDYLELLTSRVLAVDWNALPTVRDVNDCPWEFEVEHAQRDVDDRVALADAWDRDTPWDMAGKRSLRSTIEEKDLLSWEELRLREEEQDALRERWNGEHADTDTDTDDDSKLKGNA